MSALLKLRQIHLDLAFGVQKYKTSLSKQLNTIIQNQNYQNHLNLT